MAGAPERTCVACRKKGAKTEFLRVVATPAGAAVDSSGKMPGRGAYVCDNQECRAAAIERGSLARALRQSKLKRVEGLDSSS